MPMVKRMFLLALVALALVPSGAQAQTTTSTKPEQVCRKDKLNAIGKAVQCQFAAEAKYQVSAQKIEDDRTVAASIELCLSRLVDGYANAERRSGFDACVSPGTIERAIEALNETTQVLVVATETTYPACSPRAAVSSCSGIAGVTSTTCGNYFISGNGGQVSTSCFTKYDKPCTAGTAGCTCSTNGPIICEWNGSSCTDGGGFCTGS